MRTGFNAGNLRNMRNVAVMSHLIDMSFSKQGQASQLSPLAILQASIRRRYTDSKGKLNKEFASDVLERCVSHSTILELA